MTADLPPFNDLYRELSATYDALLAVGNDHLRASPSRRALRRDPDERKVPASAVSRPTEATVFDDRRLALSQARSEALVVLAYVAARLPVVRENLRASYASWSGEGDLAHITQGEITT